MDGGSLSIKNSKFSNNRAHVGGALYAHKANFTGNNVHFFQNSVNSQGGALYLENNYADNNGGPLYIDHCLFVKNSMFSNNRANFGGALYALNANLTKSISSIIQLITVEHSTAFKPLPQCLKDSLKIIMLKVKVGHSVLYEYS